MSVAAFVLAWGTIREMAGDADSDKLNDALALTGKAMLLHSVLFSIGWVL